MKQKLIYRLLVILQLIIFSSCAVDNLHDEQHSHHHKNFNIQVVDYGKLLKSDNRFRNLHGKVLKDNSSSLAMQRGAFEQSNGFTIVDTTDVKILVTDSITSYTVLVEKDNPTAGAFNNLVLQVRNNGNSPRAFLMEYRPIVLAPLQNGALIFEGYVGFKDLPFEGSEIPNREESSSDDCGTTTYIVCTKPWNSSGAGSGGHIAITGCNDSNYLFSVTVKNQCIGGGGGGNGINSGASNILNLGNLGFYPGFFGGGGSGFSTPISGGYITPSDPDDITANPVTAIATPQIKPNPKDPCTQLKNLNSIPTLTSKMTTLNNNVSGTKEKGFFMKDTPANPVSQVFEGGTDGNVTIPYLDQPVGDIQKTYGVVHNHLENNPKHIGVFTPEDLNGLFGMGAIETLPQNPFRKDTPEKSIIMVVTSIGLFALKITDLSKLTTFVQDYKTWSADKTKDYMKTIFQNSKQYNITPTSTHDEQVTGFLRFMQDKDLGVELFEGNRTDLGGWKKLTLQSNGANNYSIIPTPCPQI